MVELDLERRVGRDGELREVEGEVLGDDPDEEAGRGLALPPMSRPERGGTDPAGGAKVQLGAAGAAQAAATRLTPRAPTPEGGLAG